MEKHTPHTQKGQDGRQQAEVLADLCYRFGRPLLEKLYTKLDRRLVQTMLNLMIVIVIHRHRNHGLLLSELGGYLLNGEHARLGRNGSTTYCVIRAGELKRLATICGSRPIKPSSSA